MTVLRPRRGSHYAITAHLRAALAVEGARAHLAAVAPAYDPEEPPLRSTLRLMLTGLRSLDPAAVPEDRSWPVRRASGCGRRPRAAGPAGWRSTPPRRWRERGSESRASLPGARPARCPGRRSFRAAQTVRVHRPQVTVYPVGFAISSARVEVAGDSWQKRVCGGRGLEAEDQCERFVDCTNFAGLE